MPNAVNGVAENQILHAAMPVRAHHHQVRMNLRARSRTISSLGLRPCTTVSSA